MRDLRHPHSLLSPNLRSRFLRLFLASILFGFVVEVLFSPWHSETSYSWNSSHSTSSANRLSVTTPLDDLSSEPNSLPVIHTCRFVYVREFSQSCVTFQTSHPHLPCVWHALVTSELRSQPHKIRPPLSARFTDASSASVVKLLPSERMLMARLNGCCSEASCNATTQCSYGTEDPSDALWLRAYSRTSKFVVLLNIGVASLVFFLAAVITDGSVFYPHRPGLADASASALIMLSLASLLYVLVVPTELQFALHGKGSFQTIAYVFSICLLAILLPAIAIIWLSTTIFLIFLVGFLFEYAFLIIIATLHFLIVLVLYQVECTVLHVRLVYFANDDVDEAEHDRQLFTVGSKFLSRVRSNLLFTRLSRVVEDRALQVIRNHLPERVSTQFLQQHVPQISFDDLEDIAAQSDTNTFNPTHQPPPSPPTQPIPAPTPHTHIRNVSVTENSPLIRSNDST